MTWPVPTPDVIIDRASSVYEGTPGLAGIDARGANSVAAANCRVVGLTAFDLYLYQGYLAGELMPDTASDWLDRHAAIWGVPRLAPTYAAGTATFSSPVGTTVPAGFMLSSPGGALYATTVAGTLAAGVSASIAVQAQVAGSAADAVAGTVLAAVTPLAGLPSRSATVDADMLALDAESDDALRARLLLRIRTPPQGGAGSDYIAWAEAAGAAYAAVPVSGSGNVVVAVAMAGPAAPSAGQLAAINTAIQARRPVTAAVSVIAATITAVNVTLHLTPDTVSVRAAAVAALETFFAQDAAIGGTIFMTRLDNALSNGDGEFSHARSVPAGDVVIGATAIAVLGAVTFT